MIAVASPATAAETDSATLDCEKKSYTVTGFGRGQVLHVVGTNQNFVVTRAVRTTTGQVVFEAPGAEVGIKKLITCTTTSPATSIPFTFTGFLTPVA